MWVPILRIFLYFARFCLEIALCSLFSMSDNNLWIRIPGFEGGTIKSRNPLGLLPKPAKPAARLGEIGGMTANNGKCWR
jgi:hypothetical protein